MNTKKIFISIVVVLIFVAAGFYIDNRTKPVSPTPVLNLPVASTTTPTKNINSTSKIDFKDYGPAPDFAGINKWLNSDPLTIKGLRGQVVLIDFWTYSCINCIRTLPYVTKWYDTYKNQGLVVVGVHTPEFAFEKETGNVQDAIKHFGIHYPVAQDNDYATWQAYSNQYWPAEYLIDKNGHIVRTHFGEGEYDVTENAIRALLGLETVTGKDAGAALNGVQTPEMYFGTARLANLTPQQTPSSSPHIYSLPQEISLNNFALEGNWQFSPDNIKLVNGRGKIKLKFHAGKIHMVASSPSSAKLIIVVDGKTQPSVTVKNSELYTLFDSNDYSDHTIEITVDQSDFQAFTFTFG